jgi:hypothetical protein
MRLAHYEANLKTLNYAKRNMMNDWNAKLEMLATAFFFFLGGGAGSQYLASQPRDSFFSFTNSWLFGQAFVISTHGFSSFM